ncbi:unnamed protein product [Cuscuta epithymum]|uniref:N-alpha-acetyltransferase 60 n=1 Tax=Cuscuta epithymum TaxID=186058 RepID=A0AAV0FYQ6_9ASTE|nr:unnamed protein product [Cuscuta epithymum]
MGDSVKLTYRLLQRSDLEVLKEMHKDLFPVSYEDAFFEKFVNGSDDVSRLSWGKCYDQVIDKVNDGGEEYSLFWGWGAVDGNKLIGFATFKIVMAKDWKEADLMPAKKFDPSKPDQTLLYILTVGVSEDVIYRRHGIGTSLIRTAIKDAKSRPSCQGVCLHVLATNKAAIALYKKLSFKRVWTFLFYYPNIPNDDPGDACLYVRYLNSRSPLSFCKSLCS